MFGRKKKAEPRQTLPSYSDPFTGRTMGAYRLGDQIGRGAAGLVYRGEHVETGSPVAVKILAENLARNKKTAKRFRREALAAIKLDHPNIVKFLDAGKDAEILYIVSEFVEGSTLDAEIDRNTRLKLKIAVGYMRQVLSALQHAHENGVTHRDIKPANILITRSGEAKLIDFGIAMDREARTVLTLAGSLMGTPGYMSPEQARAKRSGPRSDLYSCGIVLFHMLTGKLPFLGKNVMDTLAMHVHEPPPSLTALVPEAPAALEQVVFRLLEKKPGGRYRSGAETLEALNAAVK